MAANYIVYVPDSTVPLTGFPKSMTVEEVRASLVATGRTALENAEVVQNGDQLTFRRTSGGTKGL